MLKPEDIKLSPVFDFSSPLYISLHDVRPTAPNGSLWRVAKVEGETAWLWSINAWGRLLQETCNVSYLREYVKGDQ